MSTAPTTLPDPASTQHLQFKRAAAVAAVGLITALALALRLYRLGALSLWSDEGISAAFVKLDWYNLGRILWRREANMALYYLLLRAWMQGGQSEAWMRLLSALASAATVPVLYLLGRRLFGVAVGLAGGLLLALHAYHIQFAQEARSYSLVTFLVAVSMYFFVRGVEDCRNRDWNWYIAASALAIYAHFFAVLVVIAQWVSLYCLEPSSVSRLNAAQQTPSPRGFLRAVKLIALWTLPIWLFIATTGAGPVAWVPRTSMADLCTFGELFSGEGARVLLGLYGVCSAATLIAAVRLVAHRSSAGWRYALVSAWFVVPVVVSLVFSLARPVFYPRFLLVALPGLVLMVAQGLFSIRPRWLAVAALAFVGWSACGGVQHYFRTFAKEDWRSATEYILSQADPGDAIVFYKPQSRFAYSYYAERLGQFKTHPVIVFPGHGDRPAWRDFMPKFEPRRFVDAAQDYRRVWLVLTQGLTPDNDPRLRQIQEAIAGRDHIIGQREFTGMTVSLYAP
jgi:4-amino-4-deoxy-L-arabinose transferase-like glycosyltransferase